MRGIGCRGKLKIVISISKLIFTPLALCCIVYFIQENLDALASILEQASVAHLCLVIAIWIGLDFVSPLFTTIAFRACALHISYPSALQIHISRLPLKYIPGGIWNSVGRAGDYRRLGLSFRQLGTYLLMENLVLIAVTFALGGSITLSALAADLFTPLFMLTTLIASFCLLLLPFGSNHLFAGMRFLLAKPDYYMSVLVLVFYWVLAGAAFAFYLMAFLGLDLSVSYLQAGGIYVFSWGVGYLTLFAPQGLGISELISGTLLRTNLSLGSITTLLMGFRLLILVSDLLLWLILKLAQGAKRK